MTGIAPSAPTVKPAVASARLALWAFLVGNLVMGTGFMMPVGILHLIAEDLSTSVPAAGALMWAGGIVLGVGGPAMAWLTSQFDRRWLLASALLLYAVGHALSALVTDFAWLLILRLITLVGAAIFPSQAAATVGLLVPPEKRATAIAFIFIGWSTAAAAVVPVSSWLGATKGWEAPFWLTAAGATIAMLLVWATVPRGLRVPTVSLRTWIDVGRHPVLPLILAVSFVQMCGAFAFWAFFGPEVARRLYPSPTLIAVMLASFGAAGVLGGILASRLAISFSASRLVQVGLGIGGLGLFLVAAAPPVAALYFVAFFVMGLGAFSVQPLQQGRLVACHPPFASATVALNSSAINLGGAAGGAIGAAILGTEYPDAMAWFAAILVFAAIGVSLLADRRAREVGT
jgi:predicted MFS family arabinose efflux permease